MYFCFYCRVSRSLNKEIKILLFLLKANEVPETGFFIILKKRNVSVWTFLDLWSFLKFCFVLFSNQIWKILKPKREAQCQCVKDRELSCSVASRHTLEVTSALFLLLCLLNKFWGETHSICTVTACINYPEKLDNPSIGFCQLSCNIRNSTKNSLSRGDYKHNLLISTRKVLKASKIKLISVT